MSRLALCDVIGPLNDLNQKLAGENGKQWLGRLKKMLRGESSGVANIDLAKAYELCGMKLEYEEVAKKFDLTEDPNLWKLLMVKGLTYAKLIAAYQKAGVKLELFDVDLEKEIDKEKEQRDAERDGDYLAAFRRNVEADEGNANQSADQRCEAKCQDITIKERLLLGLAYFLATTEHLDVKNLTQCAGSRDRYGHVPHVDWYSDFHKVSVRWYCSGGSDGSLRARSEVSSPAKPIEAEQA